MRSSSLSTKEKIIIAVSLIIAIIAIAVTVTVLAVNSRGERDNINIISSENSYSDDGDYDETGSDDGDCDETGSDDGSYDETSSDEDDQDETSPDVAMDPEFKEIVDHCRNLILNYDPVKDFEGDDKALYALEEVCRYDEDPLSKVGYVEMDVTGDGVNELLIGDVSKSENSGSNQIYTVYVKTENGPKVAFYGWSRDSFSMLDNGGFLNEGSYGAANNFAGTFKVTNSGELSCDEFYFTDTKDGSFTDTAVFSNKTGKCIIEESEELKMRPEDFYTIYEQLEANSVYVEMKSLAEE